MVQKKDWSGGGLGIIHKWRHNYRGRGGLWFCYTRERQREKGGGVKKDQICVTSLMNNLLPDFSSSGSSQQQSSLSYDVRVIRGKGDANGDIQPSKNASEIFCENFEKQIIY